MCSNYSLYLHFIYYICIYVCATGITKGGFNLSEVDLEMIKEELLDVIKAKLI